jgi:hypothetical protein
MKKVAKNIRAECWIDFDDSTEPNLMAASKSLTESDQLKDAQRKMSVAAKPSAERTTCNLPHFSISMRLFEPALAELMALSCLLVGTMAKSV